MGGDATFGGLSDSFEMTDCEAGGDVRCDDIEEVEYDGDGEVAFLHEMKAAFCICTVTINCSFSGRQCCSFLLLIKCEWFE